MHYSALVSQYIGNNQKYGLSKVGRIRFSVDQNLCNLPVNRGNHFQTQAILLRSMLCLGTNQRSYSSIQCNEEAMEYVGNGTLKDFAR